METIGERQQNLGNLKGFLLFGSQLPKRVVEMEICSFQPDLLFDFPGEV